MSGPTPVTFIPPLPTSLRQPRHRTDGAPTTMSTPPMKVDDSNAALWANLHFHSRVLVSAHLNAPLSDTITAIWRQRDPVASKKRHSLTTYFPTSSSVYASSLPVELSPASAANVHPSPSGRYSLRFMPHDVSDTMIELWGPTGIHLSFPVASSVHGSVYTDEWFGSVAWSHDETLVAYIADTPSTSKTSSPSADDVDTKPSDDTAGNSEDLPISAWAKPLKGKFAAEARGPFGEAYVKRRTPALYIANVVTGRVSVAAAPDGLLLGQPQWGAGRIICVARPMSSRGDDKPPSIPDDLGLRYCYNRPAFLVAFQAPQTFDDVTDLQNSLALVTDRDSETDYCCTSPRFSPDQSHLVYVASHRRNITENQDNVSFNFILPHNQTKVLRYMRVLSDGSFSNPQSFIDIPEEPDHGKFPGLYLHGLARRPWLSDTTLAITTTWGSAERIISSDLLSKSTDMAPVNLEKIHDFLGDEDSLSGCSTTVLDCIENKLLISVSDSANPPRLAIVTVEADKKPSLVWVSESMPEISGLVGETRTVSLVAYADPKSFSPTRVVSYKPFNPITHKAIEHFQASLTEPSSTPRALVVFPHGGPHSSSVSGFSVAATMLLARGFAVLFVNYRGSTGLGQASLETLPGNVGTQDVNEVIAATQWALSELNDTETDPTIPTVFIGGSHSGFLGAHLSLIPNLYRRTVLRNPVVNIASMVGATDIPDWCFAEAGIQSDPSRAFVPDGTQLTQMYSRSPVAFVKEATANEVKPYTLLQVGGSDKRVPPTQSLEWRRAITAAFGEGVCSLRWYENSGHAIDEVPEGDDAWIHSLDFVCEILQSS